MERVSDEYISFSQDGKMSVVDNGCNALESYHNICDIFKTQDFEVKQVIKLSISDIETLAEFDSDAKEMFNIMNGEIESFLRVNVYHHEHHRDLFNQGIYQENSFLVEHGLPGVYGPVVISSYITYHGCRSTIDISALVGMGLVQMISNMKNVPLFCV